MTLIPFLLVLPFIVGTLCLLFPRKAAWLREALAIIASLVTFGITCALFAAKPLVWSKDGVVLLRLDNLSGFILLAIGLFGFLIALYSIRFMRGKPRLNEYYCYLLWTIGAACGAVLANHLILLLVFWGFLGLTLYLLITIGGPDAASAAKKTLVIVGGSDLMLILGIGIIWALSGTFQMDKINLTVGGGLTTLAFLSLMITAFAKAGAMPMHTWIPDCAQDAPIPVTAFMPASLDKLLGIYLLGRMVIGLFVMNKAMSFILLLSGAVTVIAAVMMALIQHDLKRLLSYHAVSQVGYMVLGIGTGNPIGIAGGLFHMLNNAIYKGCLFLCGGGVEHRTKTTHLEKLGGLSRAMPITFITCLITALSISGIPPFNGFVSKWMVYQGLIELGKQGDRLWIVWLIAAMFGSALTLASFMKVIHTTFLGSKSKEVRAIEVKEAPGSMWVPMVVLAGLCVIFGVFAYSVPLRHLILRAVPGVSFPGLWSPSLATLLIIIGIVIGFFIYLAGNIRGLREDQSYIGGEVTEPQMAISGVDFYQTIREMGMFRGIYKRAEERAFDIYDISRNGLSYITRALRLIHTGILTTYLGWVLVGVAVLFWLFFKVVG